MVTDKLDINNQKVPMQDPKHLFAFVLNCNSWHFELNYLFSKLSFWCLGSFLSKQWWGKGVFSEKTEQWAFRAFIVFSPLFYESPLSRWCKCEMRNPLEIFLLQAIYFEEPQEKAKCKKFYFSFRSISISDVCIPKSSPC